jgi:hypothetical protein
LRAQTEFDQLTDRLSAAGIDVITFDDRSDVVCPDAVFPNNWFSTHRDGKVFLYPMEAPSRRLERRRDILDTLVGTQGLAIGAVIDLTHHERSNRFLEGTGSMVLDRRERIAYAARSSRTDPDLVHEFCALAGYDPYIFDAVDATAKPIYHTNVMLAIGDRFALVCAESVKDVAARARLRHKLRSSGRDVIELSTAQMQAFTANALQLSGGKGRNVIALSASARNALYTEQLARLSVHGELVSADISTIERLGGGSVRCMLAEVYLPAGVDRQLLGVNQ